MTDKYNIGSMTRRVLKWYDQATEEHIEQGMTWYEAARAFTVGLAASSPYSIEQVAGVVAVLSPQCSWKRNQQATIRLIEQHLNGNTSAVIPGYNGYSVNVGKACRVLAGDMTAIGGPKVTAFYAAIVGDLSVVTVDVWATRAARANQRNMAFVYRADEMPGAIEHRAISEAYRRAAIHRGTEPSQMQATVWCTVRDSDAFIPPQHISAREAERFYRRQVAARRQEGLTIMHGGRWAYDRSPTARRIAQEAVA